MRKRIRKKKRIGEYRAYGVEVSVRLCSAANFGVFMDDFIDVVEANSATIGGGDGDSDSLELTGFIAFSCVGKALVSQRLQAIRTWLQSSPVVASFSMTKSADAEYGLYC
ncbi:MAG: DUF469 family protein [Phycisphaerales bacterium]|nr:DUF469 family protein [Phycisphaerales bacterium]MCB9858627.1 DUF469 family protein [Phycisphaerales bacterium]